MARFSATFRLAVCRNIKTLISNAIFCNSIAFCSLNFGELTKLNLSEILETLTACISRIGQGRWSGERIY